MEKIAITSITLLFENIHCVYLNINKNWSDKSVKSWTEYTVKV